MLSRLFLSRPLDLLDAASFFTEQHYGDDGLTNAQRLIIGQRELSIMKERCQQALALSRSVLDRHLHSARAARARWSRRRRNWSEEGARATWRSATLCGASKVERRAIRKQPPSSGKSSDLRNAASAETADRSTGAPSYRAVCGRPRRNGGSPEPAEPGPASSCCRGWKPETEAGRTLLPAPRHAPRPVLCNLAIARPHARGMGQGAKGLRADAERLAAAWACSMIFVA